MRNSDPSVKTNVSQSLIDAITCSLEPHDLSRLIVGLSGGLDSSALLHALVTLKKTETNLKNIPILAIHVHHGLSEHADHWQQHCEQQCKDLSIEFITETVQLDAAKGSLENAARNARYDVFKKYVQSGDLLLLAHHQDDQVETFMMRLMRGSGLTGLTAMASQRVFAKGKIVRPWLHHSRSELETYVNDNRIAFIQDESNTDTQFDRNWWRHCLLPKLFKRYPQASQSLMKTIEVLQQERQVLDDLLQPIYANATGFDQQFTQSITLNCQALLQHTSGVQAQLIRMWLQQQGVHPGLSGDQIQTLMSDVVQAKHDAEPVYQWGQQTIRRFAGALYVVPVNPLQPATESMATIEITTDASEIHLLSPFSGTLISSQGVKSGLVSGEYQMAFYQASMSAKPLNRPTKPLKKWFQECAMPPWLRASWPIIMKHGQVACVPGVFVCDGHAVENGHQLQYRLQK